MIEINATILAQIINFLILVALLRVIAYKPVAKLLQQRSEKIQESINKAEADRKNAEDILAQYSSKLSEANKKAQEIISKAELAARKERENAITETQKEVERIRQLAKAEIENDRERVLEEVKTQIASLGLLAAKKIITKNLDAKENEKLINDFIANLDKDMLSELK